MRPSSSYLYLHGNKKKGNFMKQNTGKLVLFTALTVLVFAVFSVVAGINSASASQNATFVTTDMDSSGTTDISIGWKHDHSKQR